MSRLTPRQRQVLTLYATGNTYTEIVAAMGVSRQAVSDLTERAIVNLGARTRDEAIALAVLHGEIRLPGYEQRVEQARRHLGAAARLLGAAG